MMSALQFTRDDYGRPFALYWPEDGRLLVTASPTSLDVSWPVGRPRCLGFSIYHCGRGGMIRVHRWQLAWGRRYCYVADRALKKIHWLRGGPV